MSLLHSHVRLWSSREAGHWTERVKRAKEAADR